MKIRRAEEKDIPRLDALLLQVNLVHHRGRPDLFRYGRKYTDEDAVAEAAKAAGYTDIYKQSLISITEMEKLMGKKGFAEILGGLIYKPPGKPTLVPVSDKRQAIKKSNVNDEFNEITED